MFPPRLARISVMLAILGLNLAPALLPASAQAQGTPPAADAPKAETVRAELFKVLDPVQFKALIDAKNTKEAQERLTQADGFPNLTPYEAYVIARMRLVHAAATGNSDVAIKSLESVIASGRLAANERLEFIQMLASYYYNAKDYAKAIAWLQRHQRDSGDPATVRATLIRAYYLAGDYASAKQELRGVIDADMQAGKAPKLEDLRLLAGSAARTNDSPTYVAALEKMVAHYPSDELWIDLLDHAQSKPGYSERLRLDVYRLAALAVNALRAEQYIEMAELALAAGFPAEAKAAVDAGYAAGVLGSGADAPKHQKVRDQATRAALADQKTIARGEASAAKSQDGTGLTNLGYAYVSMGQFDKGIGLMEKGIAKGGLKRPDDARLHLGIAYAKAGHKADAIRTFEAVQGDDGLSDLARYWRLWLDRPDATAPVTTH